MAFEQLMAEATAKREKKDEKKDKGDSKKRHMFSHGHDKEKQAENAPPATG